VHEGPKGAASTREHSDGVAGKEASETSTVDQPRVGQASRAALGVGNEVSPATSEFLQGAVAEIMSPPKPVIATADDAGVAGTNEAGDR